jgi:hypothetical protein
MVTKPLLSYNTTSFSIVQANDNKHRVADDKKAANTIISGTLQLRGFEVYSVTNAMECLINRPDMEKGQTE